MATMTSLTNMKIPQYLYKTAFIVTAIGLFTLLLCLGFWQLDRAKQKQNLLDDYQNRQAQGPINFDAAEKRNYQPIEVSGYFDNRQQFLLDNQFYQHQVGYQVITPLQIQPNQPLLLINRGWIPRAKSRSILPTIASVEKQVKLQGMIYSPSTKGLLLTQQIAETTGWPRVIEKIDFDYIAQQLGQPIYPFMIMLDENQVYGFKRNWQPSVIPPSRHLGYAVQWFALAGVFLIACLILLKRW